jgi:hypothetical protein
MVRHQCAVGVRMAAAERMHGARLGTARHQCAVGVRMAVAERMHGALQWPNGDEVFTSRLHGSWHEHRATCASLVHSDGQRRQRGWLTSSLRGGMATVASGVGRKVLQEALYDQGDVKNLPLHQKGIKEAWRSGSPKGR